MCNKNSPPHTHTTTHAVSNTKTKKDSTMKTRKKIRKQNKDVSSSSTNSNSTTSSSLKPLRRRNRSKTRKPKYFSLRLQLSQRNTDKKNNQPKKTKMTPQQQQQQQPQLNLFPLHPENTVDDKDYIIMHGEENNVALLFSSDGGATLTGLLEDESTTTATTTAAASEEASFSTPAVECGVGDGGSWLVRKAMRRREVMGEGMSEEERWVCYSEVTSGGGGGGGTTSFGSLSLKLDHEGILNAWSDKRSLYVAGEAPQTVPDLHNEVFLYNALPTNIACDGWSSDTIGNMWSVPEICVGDNDKMKMKEEMDWKLGQREASVQRYREKRQNRLFSKRIRYEVRKLNAEKRPRMKGRFVKRE